MCAVFGRDLVLWEFSVQVLHEKTPFLSPVPAGLLTENQAVNKGEDLD